MRMMKNMNITVLGQGVWGFCLSCLLAKKGHAVSAWTRDSDILEVLQKGKNHPHLPINAKGLNISFYSDIHQAVAKTDIIVESVTASGLRSILDIVKETNKGLVLTSKGIDPEEGKLLPELAQDILEHSNIALLSGPSFATEVCQNLPTAVVMGSFNILFAKEAASIFNTNMFRVYPNIDIEGVALGGALKNVVAIACGISEGLKLGTGAKAALMTRGLHEIARLAHTRGCQMQTLYGLSGMGDLFLTCSSTISRNYRFGTLLAQGFTENQAKQEIGMVVEGASTCHSAMTLAENANVELPICTAVHEIISGQLTPQEAVEKLMQRIIKEERV